MNRIVIEAVPKDAMREPYCKEDQAGDWIFDTEGNLVIKVVGKDFAIPETFLFALHELVEAYLCQREGISQEAVDEFDREFASYEGQVRWGHIEEPGDCKEAPYRTQHRRAMLAEHIMANFMGLLDYGTVT